MEIDFTNADVLATLKGAGWNSKDETSLIVTDSNKSLETNRNDILSQLQASKDKIKGIDLDAYGKLAEDSRFKSILSGGLDEYERGFGGEVSERLRAAQSDLMLREQNHLSDQKKFEDKEREFGVQITHSELKRKLGMAMIKNELIDPLAYGDIERSAMDELSLDAQGGIIVMGENGTPQQTADGPMRETDWLDAMMKKKPYLFRGASGSNRTTEQGQLDPSKMTPAEKMRAGRRK